MLHARQIGFRGIVVNTFLTSFVFTIWQVIFNNFGREVFHASASQIGMIQAVREIPGFLGFGVGLLALFAPEVRIATVSIALNGLGLVIAGLADSIWMLGVGTFVMSVGFHYFYTANQSLLLRFIRGKESGRLQGVAASWEATAGVGGTLVVFVFALVTGYRVILISTGAAFVVIGLVLTFMYKSNRAAGEKSFFSVKRDYWLYYVISFLRGCRRHMFTTFAIWLLVANHSLKIEYTALLFLTTSAISIYTSRLFGNLTEQIGERLMLASTSFILIFVFWGYAYLNSLYALIALYVFDSVLFGSSVALNSYLRKIAPKEDMTNALSLGGTANHIAAIVIPIAGGVMWDAFGFRNTFLMGAAIVFADMGFSLLVNPNAKRFGKSLPVSQ
jgi:MFS family permease